MGIPRDGKAAVTVRVLSMPATVEVFKIQEGYSGYLRTCIQLGERARNVNYQ
jgi:hypothetical protein